MKSYPIKTQITNIEQVAEKVCAYTLSSFDGNALPDFSAGAHVDVILDNGMVRQYSLCGELDNKFQYKIAVLYEAEGRGGSAYIHENFKEGDLLDINPPRNNFKLDFGFENYILIAGGIGITPIVLMASELRGLGKSFTLHYLCRTPEQAAFLTKLQQQFYDNIVFHYSYGEASRRLDIDNLFSSQPPDTQVYTCGSEILLQSILNASDKYKNITVHFERFSAAPIDENYENKSFEIELARSGSVLTVQAEQSILEALRNSGYQVETMCEEGLCGSCEVNLLAGEAEHRDSVLTEEEKSEQNVLMVCCSRARSSRLTLDI